MRKFSDRLHVDKNMSDNISSYSKVCPVCSGEGRDLYTIRNRGVLGVSDEYNQEILSCDGCDLVYTANPVDEKVTAEFYKKLANYEYSSNSRGVAHNYNDNIRRQYRYVEEHLSEGMSILEIGAADGTNLNYYKEKGFRVFGIEPSALNKNTAWENYGIELFAGTFEEYEERSDNKEIFDLVILSHVLEHFVEPKTMLNKIKDFNARYLLIEVPAMDARFDDEPFGSFFFEHVNYFSYASLSYLLSEVGYNGKKISVDYNAEHPVLISLWEKRNTEKEAPPMKQSAYRCSDLLKLYFNSSEKRMEEIQKKIDAIPDTARVAVWGTGSHTSRLLGMTNLYSKNIIRFYDSDLKKQEFQLMGKEIAAFSHQDVKENNIDTIVVSTYSGEASILSVLEKSGLNIPVVSFYR